MTCLLLLHILYATALPAASDSGALAREVHSRGWIGFSAKGETGDWDLYVIRPDGTGRRKLTDTREYNETGVRFSPDGKHALFYRQPVNEPVDNNTYGIHELMIADADGANARSLGRSFAWASWGPDSKSLATLSPRGIRIMDIATTAVMRTRPRAGIVEQLVWSPDGRFFVGTANGLGPYWNIGLLNFTGGNIRAMSETERYNCTPDWMPDSSHLVYSRGTIPEKNEPRSTMDRSAGGARPPHALRRGWPARLRWGGLSRRAILALHSERRRSRQGGSRQDHHGDHPICRHPHARRRRCGTSQGLPRCPFW